MSQPPPTPPTPPPPPPPRPQPHPVDPRQPRTREMGWMDDLRLPDDVDLPKGCLPSLIPVAAVALVAMTRRPGKPRRTPGTKPYREPGPAQGGCKLARAFVPFFGQPWVDMVAARGGLVPYLAGRVLAFAFPARSPRCAVLWAETGESR